MEAFPLPQAPVPHCPSSRSISGGPIEPFLRFPTWKYLSLSEPRCVRVTLPLSSLEFPTRRLWRREGLKCREGAHASPPEGREGGQRKQETVEQMVGVNDGGRGTSENSSLRGCFQRWTGVLWPWLGIMVPAVHSQGAFLTRDGNDGKISWTV